MPTISRILCPVDFSESSHSAFAYANDFASWIGAELVLIHAFDDPASYDRQGQQTPADPAIVAKLDTVKSHHANIKLKRMLHAGPAGQVICWAAQDQECELIIMGTHGRTGLKHLLFGSTAEYVLRHATSPVLTVRAPRVNAEPLPEPFVTPVPAPPYM